MDKMPAWNMAFCCGLPAGDGKNIEIIQAIKGGFIRPIFIEFAPHIHISWFARRAPRGYNENNVLKF